MDATLAPKTFVKYDVVWAQTLKANINIYFLHLPPSKQAQTPPPSTLQATIQSLDEASPHLLHPLANRNCPTRPRRNY